jgi:hypothetical protein
LILTRQRTRKKMMMVFSKHKALYRSPDMGQ